MSRARRRLGFGDGPAQKGTAPVSCLLPRLPTGANTKYALA
jgi:hypothetical protein